jgi:hypothetical protein
VTRALLLSVALGLAACGGTTGNALVTFSARASGPSDANGAPMSFTNGFGTPVTLTRARLTLGAVYLNQNVPVSGAAASPCILPGTYVGQVFGPVAIDLLSSAPVAFPSPGEGTATPAKVAEIWLTSGDIDAVDNAQHVLEVEGTFVTAGGDAAPFSGIVTIGANRKLATTNPSLPGANPICHQRIVGPVSVSLTPSEGGILTLAVDPRVMFSAVDFSTLTATGSSPVREIPDTSAGAGGALYKGMMANAGVYSIGWVPAP